MLCLFSCFFPLCSSIVSLIHCFLQKSAMLCELHFLIPYSNPSFMLFLLSLVPEQWGCLDKSIQKPFLGLYWWGLGPLKFSPHCNTLTSSSRQNELRKYNKTLDLPVKDLSTVRTDSMVHNQGSKHLKIHNTCLFTRIAITDFFQHD